MSLRTLQLLFVLFLAVANYALAQQGQTTPMVAVPTITAGPNDPMLGNLRRALRELGYVEGQNIRIEHRFARGDIARLPAIVEELIRLRPSVIVARLGPIVESAEKATKTIPIIMVGWDYDPVAAGYVKTLNRPEGNITGIYLRADETIGKRLELLKELIPGISSVAVVYDNFGKRQFAQVDSAANKLGLKIVSVLVRDDNFERALRTAKAHKSGAAMILQSSHFYVNRAQIAQTARAEHIATTFQDDSYVSAGGLISYEPNIVDAWARVAYFIDRILKGAKAADLPIEQPASYKLVVNSTTSQALGVTIPGSILLRADEVIR